VRSQFEDIRNQIIKCLSMVEALIDFGEGEEIEEGVHEQGISLLYSISYFALPILSQLENARRLYGTPFKLICGTASEAKSFEVVYD
jgi:tRNA U34 5-carboxymethylaminomethyl modifying GTPase MnmE/TrmE